MAFFRAVVVYALGPFCLKFTPEEFFIAQDKDFYKNRELSGQKEVCSGTLKMFLDPSLGDRWVSPNYLTGIPAAASRRTGSSATAKISTSEALLSL